MILSSPFLLLQQKIYISTVSAGQTGKAPSLYARRFFVPLYPFSDTEGGIRKRSCGYIKAAAALQGGEGFGSAKDAERCILRKIRRFSRHVRPRLPKRRALPKRQRTILPFAQAAARRPRRLFCRKTFVHRLARRFSAVLRDGSHASAARDGPYDGGMPSEDAFRRPEDGGRQANFVEIRRLKGKLSTYPHGYPQCRRFMP